MLESALKGGYQPLTFLDFMENQPTTKVFVLRHDVDNLPQNSLATAQVQSELGLKGTYYFRIVPQSNQPGFIEKIAALGHEIGYHYEDLTLARGDSKLAIEMFEKNLAYFRKFYPVKTICMHGSPTSSYDNRDVWKEYSYKDYGIIAEPYFDVDFNEVLYLTDTGRTWANTKASRRDKVDGLDHSYKSTQDLIQAFDGGELPDKIMHNIHPQRWTDETFLWYKEYMMQSIKNPVKRLINTFSFS